jgi:type IV fimbrial biogenesis protein FimT
MTPTARPSPPCPTCTGWQAGAGAGFTLIELLVVMAIAGILLAVGLPSFQDFVREQRVRSIASDMVGDFALARSEAVRYSGRVIMARAGFAGCTEG